MTRPVAIVALLLALLTFTSTAQAQKCKRDEATTVDIELGNNSLTYPTSEEDSGPSVCRGNAFTIQVTWTDDTVNRLRLNGFRPVLIRTRRVENMNNTELPDPWSNRHFSITRRCAAPCTDTRLYNLPSSWDWRVSDPVNTRMIMMTAEMTLSDETVVSFDTAWAERP